MKSFRSLLICALLLGCSEPPPPATLDINRLLGGVADTGFERALASRPFIFPQDHGQHPAFRNEWWYVTGNVQTKTGRQLGFQVTFFRIALAPDGQPRKSKWATRQVWMAHAALSDIENRYHYSDERLVRGAAGLAGARLEPFAVWVEDWRLTAGANAGFPWWIQVKTDEFDLKLALNPLKPLVLQGEKGLSQKSAEPGNASYYYSWTRLNTTGKIRIGGETLEVTGLAWLDREWSTRALSKEQTGWDWFSLQFIDGRDLMYYRLRKTDGTTDDHSAGKFIEADGSTRPLHPHQVKLTVQKVWTAKDGRRYPVSWFVEVPEENLSLRVEAAFNDQQMPTAVRYWEGAVRVFDTATDKPLGAGYLEMTGY